MLVLFSSQNVDAILAAAWVVVLPNRYTVLDYIIIDMLSSSSLQWSSIVFIVLHLPTQRADIGYETETSAVECPIVT